MKKLLVKGITAPSLILIAVNLLNFVFPLPVSVQMITSAVALTYIGCILSVPIQSATYKEIQKCENQMRSRSEQSSCLKICWQIGVYPLTATVTLLLLYLLVSHIQQMTKELLLNIIFMVGTTSYCIKKFHKAVLRLVKYCLQSSEISDEIASCVQCIVINIIFPIVCALPAFIEIATKHWLIDNMYAIAFTVLAIKEANLKSFKIALPVLWLLFFYDLYWVYESDVMVTVAKNIDLPLKLKFPYFEEVTNQVKFGMLGLGDIVIPGLLISLCIKYDIDSCILSDRKPKKVEEFTYPLFYSMLSAYTLSLIATYLALYYFEHPQPALVFIVPICSFALLSFSYFSKNYALWKYDSKNLTRKSSVESIGQQTEIVI